MKPARKQSGHPVPAGQESILRDAALLIGSARGVRLVRTFTQAAEIALVRQIRETDAYKHLGFPTWEAFCSDGLHMSKRTVNEDLQFADTFGEEFLQLAGDLGLGRRALRALLPHADTGTVQLLPSGEIEIGDRRIAVDAANKGEIAEALTQLSSELAYLRNKGEDAEAAAQEKDEELAELGKENEALRGKLAERKEEEKRVKRFEQLHVAATGEIREGVIMCASTLAHLAQRAESERPDPEEVLQAVRILAPIVSRLTDYGRHREVLAAKAPQIDPVLMDQVLRDMANDEEDDDA